MAGLLDTITGNWTDDPNQNAAIRQGLLSGVFGAMAGRGNRMQALGQGGLLGLSGYSSTLAAQEQAARDAQAREAQALQTQALRSQLERQQAMQGLAQQFYRPEQTLPGEVMPQDPQEAFRAAELTGTLPSPQMGAPRTTPAGFDFAGYADALAQFDPMESARLRASLQKDRTPLKVGRGETLLDPETRQPIYTSPNQGDPSGLGQLMAEMNALPEGHQMRSIYLQAIQKAATHAPGASVNVGLQAPTQVTDPSTGQPILIQPANKPGAAPQVLTDPKTGQPFGAIDKKSATEFQEKAGLYFKSMQQASQTLEKLESGPGGRVSLDEAIIPNESSRNVVRSPARRQYVQGQKQWIDSINRVRSGANLPELEYDRAVMTFFPQYGDDAATVEQKRVARQQEETAMRSAAGPAIKGPTPTKTVTVDY